MVGGAHGVDGDVGEGTRVEALHLDVVAEGGEIAVESAELAARTVVVGVLQRRRLRRYRHLHRGAVGSGIRELGLHWANYAITVCIMVGARDRAVAVCVTVWFGNECVIAIPRVGVTARTSNEHMHKPGSVGPLNPVTYIFRIN